MGLEMQKEQGSLPQAASDQQKKATGLGSPLFKRDGAYTQTYTYMCVYMRNLSPDLWKTSPRYLVADSVFVKLPTR